MSALCSCVECVGHLREPPEDCQVDCCSDECGWTGLSSQCVTFKHWPGEILCPECREVVEPVHDDG
jgi:hypothetical protein